MNKWFFLIVIFDFVGFSGVVYLSDAACPDLILIDVGDSVCDLKPNFPANIFFHFVIWCNLSFCNLFFQFFF